MARFPSLGSGTCPCACYGDAFGHDIQDTATGGGMASAVADANVNLTTVLVQILCGHDARTKQKTETGGGTASVSTDKIAVNLTRARVWLQAR